MLAYVALHSSFSTFSNGFREVSVVPERRLSGSKFRALCSFLIRIQRLITLRPKRRSKNSCFVCFAGLSDTRKKKPIRYLCIEKLFLYTNSVQIFLDVSYIVLKFQNDRKTYFLNILICLREIGFHESLNSYSSFRLLLEGDPGMAGEWRVGTSCPGQVLQLPFLD